MSAEEVLSSKPRIRILKALYNVGELNVSEMARKLKINYLSASRHVKFLEEAGILQHKMFGRIRLYRFNEHSKKAKAIENLIEAWEDANST